MHLKPRCSCETKSIPNFLTHNPHKARLVKTCSDAASPRHRLTTSQVGYKSSLTAAHSQAPPSAAIITLNTVRKSERPFAPPLLPPRFLADSSAYVCAVLEQAGIQRIVVMSTADVGDSSGPLPWVSKAFMGWTNVKYALQDHNLVDKKIWSTKLDWTLVKASRLEFDDPKKQKTDTEAGMTT